MNSNAKIGLFGTGLDTYWGQFDGLLDELKGYQARIRDRMERDAGVQVADAGMVDSPARALEAASLFAREQVDLVFLYMATYCLSSTILPVVQRLNCPVVVLNLQPTPAIDYERLNALGDRGRMTGMWLANCQACSAPEIASVLARSHRRCAFVTGWARRSGRLAGRSASGSPLRASVPVCVGTGSAYWDTTTGGCSTYIPTSRASRPSSGRTSNCSKCASCTPCERR